VQKDVIKNKIQMKPPYSITHKKKRECVFRVRPKTVLERGRRRRRRDKKKGKRREESPKKNIFVLSIK
jgi:hypothetical protein